MQTRAPAWLALALADVLTSALTFQLRHAHYLAVMPWVY